MFDRETIIHTCATLFVVAAIIFGVTLSLRIWQKRERKRVAVVLEPIPLTEEQEADLYTALEALERVIATLEQDEAYQRLLKGRWRDEATNHLHCVRTILCHVAALVRAPRRGPFVGDGTLRQPHQALSVRARLGHDGAGRGNGDTGGRHVESTRGCL